MLGSVLGAELPVVSSRGPVRPLWVRFSAWTRRDLSAGLLLAFAAGLGLLAANTPVSGAYERVRDFAVGPESLGLRLTVGQWVTDGLLVVFFFLIGTELKRELVAGSLRDPARALVPVVAAVGGVVVPVAVYLGVVAASGDSQAARGWAVPTATDVPFALAVLVVVARNLPAALRSFLLTLAVSDDLVAITVVAVGYHQSIDLIALGLAVAGVLGFAVAASRYPTRWLLVPLALLTWGFMHASGVHTTIAGVLLGLAVPVFDPGCRPASQAARVTSAAVGPAARTEHRLRPWAACLVVPLFGFFAAGVTVSGVGGFAEVVTAPVALGIVAGLVVGKPLGILAATFAVTRLPRVHLDPDLQWFDMAGIAMLGGVGFTVSLLVGDLAFSTTGALDDQAKVGVLVGSATASVLAGTLFAFRGRHHQRQNRPEP